MERLLDSKHPKWIKRMCFRLLLFLSVDDCSAQPHIEITATFQDTQYYYYYCFICKRFCIFMIFMITWSCCKEFWMLFMSFCYEGILIAMSNTLLKLILIIPLCFVSVWSFKCWKEQQLSYTQSLPSPKVIGKRVENTLDTSAECQITHLKKSLKSSAYM